MYILRSYKEAWLDMLKAQAGPEEVTRLPKRKIGQAYGVYVITGKAHKEAAEYMQAALEECAGLADEIRLHNRVEDEFEVAISIDYT